MDRAEAIKCASEYARVASEEMSGANFFLFGSYANETPTPDSDIDVAILCDTSIINWWQQSSKLYEIAFQFDSRIEPVVLDSKNDTTGFVAEVLKTGIPLSI